ncbi:MAG TPA: nucleotidyltransferase domain-containing protein [Lacipirellulaceae bacterium]|nr:nucleotidyltransferase domain-containing protein [Lacipirellulaceae bacterium]
MATRTEIQDVADRIAQEFSPDKVILFGSHARGTQGPDSDVDLLVLLPCEGKSFWKSIDILNRVRPQFAIDLIARDTADAAARYAQGDPLIHDAFDYGQVLYERCR